MWGMCFLGGKCRRSEVRELVHSQSRQAESLEVFAAGCWREARSLASILDRSRKSRRSCISIARIAAVQREVETADRGKP